VVSSLAGRIAAIALALIAAPWVPARAQAAPDAGSSVQRAPADWFHVIAIDKDTYALSEPRYWQQNVSYLLLGTRRALLFDTGPGIYGIREVVRSLTRLPVVVIPSHLHFDHVGDLREFDDVRLLDTAALRAQAHGGYFTEESPQYMLRGTERFRVNGWVKDGARIDLGHRSVRVFGTPGHTPDSVSVLEEPGRRRMFTGDLVNRLVTLCDVPGSDIHALAASLHRLLAMAPAGSLAYEAHAEVPLQAEELLRLDAGLPLIAAGTAASVPSCLGGLPMRRFEIGEFAILLPAEGGRLMKPLGSATETLDWLAGACPGS
jgi:glyoxylase-like metal-dependent hydrolase (beta-lactamase superfamily II)